MDVVPLLFGLVFGGVGVGLLVSGGKSVRHAQAIRSNDPLEVRTLPRASEPLEFQGTAELPAGEDPLEAPYSGAETVCYESRIREKRNRGSSSSGRSRSTWTTVESGGESRPFVVDDGTGRVEVDPGDATLELDWETVDRDGSVGPFGGTLSLDVSLGPLGVGSRPRKYQERRLDPGETVHVYGARTTGEGGGWDSDVDAAVAACEEASLYQLTDGTERDAVRSQLTSALGAVAGGLLFVGFGVLAVLGSI